MLPDTPPSCTSVRALATRPGARVHSRLVHARVRALTRVIHPPARPCTLVCDALPRRPPPLPPPPTAATPTATSPLPPLHRRHHHRRPLSSALPPPHPAARGSSALTRAPGGRRHSAPRRPGRAIAPSGPRRGVAAGTRGAPLARPPRSPRPHPPPDVLPLSSPFSPPLIQRPLPSVLRRHADRLVAAECSGHGCPVEQSGSPLVSGGGRRQRHRLR